MKKLLAILLAAMLMIPFGMLSMADEAPGTEAVDTAVGDGTPDAPDAPAKIELPAEPVATSNKYVYTAYDYAKQLTPQPPVANTANDGQTLDTIYRVSAFSAIRALFGEEYKDATTDNTTFAGWNALKDGGYFVVVGKVLVGLGPNWNYEGVIPATTAPLVITAKDPTNGTSYISTQDGEIHYMNASGGNEGQYGMFMMDAGTATLSNTVVFEGDVIFTDTVILNRTNANSAAAGNLAPTISTKSKLVIDASMKFASMTGEQKYTLDVQEGAYAFLHALGFGKYTGKGTIVVGDEIKDAVSEDMFAAFCGIVADKDGNVLYDLTSNTPADDNTNDTTPPADTDPVETKPATTNKPSSNTSKPATTTKTETTTNAPATTTSAPAADDAGISPIIFVVAGVAVVAVVVVVVIVVSKKKKAQ